MTDDQKDDIRAVLLDALRDPAFAAQVAALLPRPPGGRVFFGNAPREERNLEMRDTCSILRERHEAIAAREALPISVNVPILGKIS